MYKMILKLDRNNGGILAGQTIARTEGLQQVQPFILDMEEVIECVAGSKDEAKAALLSYYRRSLEEEVDAMTAEQISHAMTGVVDLEEGLLELEDGLASEDIDHFAKVQQHKEAQKVPVIYTVRPSDLEESYMARCRPGEEVDIEKLLDWVEKDLTEKGLRLAEDWRKRVYC